MTQADLQIRADLQALVDRHTDALRRRDPVALAANHSVDGVVESPMFATLRGREAIEHSYRAAYTSFPDWEVTVDTLVIAAPQIALFGIYHATHLHDFCGVPGTHKRFTGPLASLFTVADGLIVSERRIYDFTGLLVQIGVLRAKPARP